MTRPAAAGFRPDVQGLRALAVGLVVVYHLYPKALPGGYIGVDVFFVISGFLITGLLVRSFTKTGKVGLLDFWGRRARRLMPAAVLVLAVTWVASREFLPVTQLDSTATQIRASALYFQNWVLAGNSVDYLKSEEAPTPVQHYWSLSVEEQFYVVWPLLFALGSAVVWFVGRRRRPVVEGGRHRRAVTVEPGRTAGRATVLALALVILGASLWYSVYETKANPAAAYFVTTTRMWELAVGGVLALLPTVALRRIGRVGLLAWVGLAMVVYSAFQLSDKTPFPGLAAVVPVLGAALMLASGSADAKLGTQRLTSNRIAVFLGDISYSLYLWHWPVTVLTKAYTGHNVGPRTGVMILGVSIVLAWLTKKFVEDPIRTASFVTRSRLRSLATATVAIVPVALVSIWLSGQPGPNAKLDDKHVGAAAISKSPASAPTPLDLDKLVPSLAQAPADRPQAMDSKCESNYDQPQVKLCTRGDTKTPKLTVAVIGDSHMAMWSDPLIEIAKKRHWKLVFSAKGGCPLTTIQTRIPLHHEPYTSCSQWAKSMTDKLINDIKPDIMLTHSRSKIAVPPAMTPNDKDLKKVADGVAATWRKLEAHDIDVVGMGDTPEQVDNVPKCLAARGGSVEKCSKSRKEAVTDRTSVMRLAAAEMDGKVPLIDMTRYLCKGKTCPVVVGNVVVYLDSHHLTATYTKTLQPYLDKELVATRPVAIAIRSA